MRDRRMLAAVGLGATVLAACAPGALSPGGAGGDGAPFDPTYGCTGVCSDAGAAGPTWPGSNDSSSCSSFVADGGVAEVSLGALRQGCSGQKVRVRGVVVHALESEATGEDGTTVARFWVVDPAQPGAGMFVDRRGEDHVDGVPAGHVSVGDRVDVEGYVGPVSWFEDHVGYRITLKGMRYFTPVQGGELRVTRTDAGVLPGPNVVGLPPGSGTADGGALLLGPALAGTRVHVTGPLELVDPSPLALRPLNALADAGVSYGYAVTGGILVVDRRPDGTPRLDGGEAAGCDWRSRALAAGDGARVVFDGGIQGVWDTYTHAPCEDGGVAPGCPARRGTVPDAGTDFTYVLYPQSCADVPGEVVPAEP